MKKPRPLPELIKNFRGGVGVKSKIDWNNLNKTIEACAKEASKKGYLYFGLQFYGECWSGPEAHKTYERYGKSNSCTLGVGKKRANMVYMLTGEGELRAKRCMIYGGRGGGGWGEKKWLQYMRTITKIISHRIIFPFTKLIRLSNNVTHN